MWQHGAHEISVGVRGYWESVTRGYALNDAFHTLGKRSAVQFLIPVLFC